VEFQVKTFFNLKSTYSLKKLIHYNITSQNWGFWTQVHYLG